MLSSKTLCKVHNALLLTVWFDTSQSIHVSVKPHIHTRCMIWLIAKHTFHGATHILLLHHCMIWHCKYACCFALITKWSELYIQNTNDESIDLVYAHSDPSICMSPQKDASDQVTSFQSCAIQFWPPFAAVTWQEQKPVWFDKHHNAWIF